jgi:hypothetical protein
MVYLLSVNALTSYVSAYHPSYQTAVHMNCICSAWKDRHYPAGLSQMNSIDLDSPLSLRYRSSNYYCYNNNVISLITVYNKYSQDKDGFKFSL